jgi:hypothetical protein
MKGTKTMRLKYRCELLQKGPRNVKVGDHEVYSEGATCELRPVVGDDLNRKAFASVPDGVLRLQILSPEASQKMELGKEFDVLLLPAGELDELLERAARDRAREQAEREARDPESPEA